MDSKTTHQVEWRLDRGSFSSNKKVQDLLAMLSANRRSIQQTSTEVPSLLLKVINSVSHNSVKRVTCTLCEEMKEANVVFFTRKTIQKKEEAFGHEVLCKASLLRREVTGSNFADEEMKQTAYDVLLTLESKLVMLASLICKQDF